MDLEIVTLSEVIQGQTSYDITQTWNPIFLKKKRNEIITEQKQTNR